MEMLIKLEKLLHDADIRNSALSFSELLHAEFREVGMSGITFNRQEMINDILKESPNEPLQIHSQNFETKQLAQEVCQIMYETAVKSSDNSYKRFAKRSSIWIENNGKWQILYHQGTPCSPFEIINDCLTCTSD